MVEEAVSEGDHSNQCASGEASSALTPTISAPYASFSGSSTAVFCIYPSKSEEGAGSAKASTLHSLSFYSLFLFFDRFSFHSFPCFNFCFLSSIWFIFRHYVYYRFRNVQHSCDWDCWPTGLGFGRHIRRAMNRQNAIDKEFESKVVMLKLS